MFDTNTLLLILNQQNGKGFKIREYMCQVGNLHTRR